MQLIDALFIQNSAGIFLVSGLFFATSLALSRSNGVAKPGALLWPALAWALWAVWEFLVQRFTPEANIRVDLLLILPVVLVVSLVGIVLLFIRRKPSGPTPSTD